MSNYTPSQIIQELQQIQNDAAIGVRALYEAEVKLAHAENAYEREVNLAFLNTEAKLATERTAISKLKASDKRLEADLAKAEYNRIKLKLKQLELAQMSTQTIARQVETEMKVLR